MNRIRNFFSTTLAIALCAFAPLREASAAALWPHQLGIGGQDNNTEVFSGKSANLAISGTVSSNLAYFITSANTIGTPRVTYLSAFTDAGTVTPLTAYTTSTNSLTVVTNQALSTNRFTVASTATLATNDVLVLRGSNDVYQMLIVSNIDSATVFATYQATTNALSINDTFYEMNAGPTINIANLGGGSTTAFTAPNGIFQGQTGIPLLITLGASNATPSLLVTGEYYRRLRP